MINHKLQNIQTSLDENNKITSINFNLLSVDETTLTEVEQSWIKQYAEPFGDGHVYTDDELTTLAVNIAAENKMYEKAEVIIANKLSSPTFSDPNAISVIYHPIPTEEESRAQMVATIENKIADAYSVASRFQLEYDLKEKAAIQFKSNNYKGEPSVWISSYATLNKITNKECADLILKKVAQFKSNIEKLGLLRMNKYKITNAESMDKAISEFKTIIQACIDVATDLS